ncbi:right-handed parallel beta-helix repeat-containing protein [Natronorarus salvus]|uniref:right-handed parallel beta-helix repeat-containing protein n=1 Tax=Natronorarus salvus TaxID=3117733 RepID=UPI002F25F8E6
MNRSLEETYKSTGRREGRILGRRTLLRTVGAAGIGLAASKSASATDSDNPTEIDSCAVIDEPGEYEIVSDITPDLIEAPGCIVITADDVYLNGNGYTIDIRDAEFERVGFYEDPRAIAVNPFALERDVTILDDVVIENVDILGGSGGIEYTFTGGRTTGITVRESGSGIRIRFQGPSVEQCTLEDNITGIDLQGDPDVYGGTGSTIDHCTIQRNRSTGVFVGHEMSSTITACRVLRNGIGVLESVFGGGSQIRDSNICFNEHYGVSNIDTPADDEFPEFSNITDAIENYWGAANGPSSFGDPPTSFTDPETGRPADGDGDVISESLDPGVSNVRFDPFLEEPNRDAGDRR